jgi:hypothetical protein
MVGSSDSHSIDTFFSSKAVLSSLTIYGPWDLENGLPLQSECVAVVNMKTGNKIFGFVWRKAYSRVAHGIECDRVWRLHTLFTGVVTGCLASTKTSLLYI